MESDSLKNLIVVGDKVLIKPCTDKRKTKNGLFLPPGYSEKEEIRNGFVVKTGPGIPVPYFNDDDFEPWKKNKTENIKYIPLQAQTGDLAIYVAKNAIEISYNEVKYFIVYQHDILLLERDTLI